jgi:AraC-like DNA-binding protein
MKNNLTYKRIKPDTALDDFVCCFSSLQNLSKEMDGIIIPNGRVDLIFALTENNELHISLMGLETQPKYANQTVFKFFAINFNPLAVEYVFQDSIADILNSGKVIPSNFWNFDNPDMDDFDSFCEKASRKIKSLLPNKIDERKRSLFKLIFETNGAMSIKELSEKVAWSERQINRYFSQQFGLSLKTYCNILRFQASLAHIKDGELFPQLNFTDQSHFIKEIKKLSGVSPKELFKNENDRFLQFLMFKKD